MTDEDEVVLVAGERGALVSRCRIDPPFEDAQRDVHRARDTAIPSSNIDVARDGASVIALMPATRSSEEQTPNHVTLLLNFFDELRRRGL